MQMIFQSFQVALALPSSGRVEPTLAVDVIEIANR
jgi:hypothetical protein